MKWRAGLARARPSAKMTDAVEKILGDLGQY